MNVCGCFLLIGLVFYALYTVYVGWVDGFKIVTGGGEVRHREVAGSNPDDVIGFFYHPTALWPWGHSASNRNEYQ